MKSLSKIQEEVWLWSYANFGSRSGACGVDQFIGIVEEVGELAHALLKQIQGIRQGEDLREKERDAVGDIMIYLLDFCARRGYSAEEVLNETWELVKKRNWKENPENGT